MKYAFDARLIAHGNLNVALSVKAASSECLSAFDKHAANGVEGSKAGIIYRDLVDDLVEMAQDSAVEESQHPVFVSRAFWVSIGWHGQASRGLDPLE